MVFGFVRPIALNAFGTLDMARKCGMTPPPAIFALRYARVHGSSPDSSDVVTYIKTSVDEEFSIVPTLNIPNVNPDNGHVRLGGDFDNSWFERKGYVIENMVLL